MSAADWGVLIPSVITMMTAAATWLRADAAARNSRKNEGAIQEVHVMVNNQLDRQLIYSQQLSKALVKGGVAVPQQDKPPSEPPPADPGSLTCYNRASWGVCGGTRRMCPSI